MSREVSNAPQETSCPEAGQDDNFKRIDSASLDNLSKGFLQLYVSDLEAVSGPLDELKSNQEVLIDTVTQENTRFSDAKQTYNFDEMFGKIAQYQTKLLTIKKEMAFLHDKTAKLKKRALRLRLLKEKEALQRNK